MTELECLAAILSVKKFRPYIDGVHFRIITDHSSLKWLMSQKDLSGRLARWSLQLQRFDFVIEHRKDSLNVVPDCLSKMNVEEVVLSDMHCEVNLLSPEFDNDEYCKLRETVAKN